MNTSPFRGRRTSQGFGRNIELLMLLTMAALGVVISIDAWRAGLRLGGVWPYVLATGGGILGFLILPLFGFLCMFISKVVTYFRKR